MPHSKIINGRPLTVNMPLYKPDLYLIRCALKELGLFQLKEYGRGGRLFFQTLPPSFYIFRLDPPSLIAQL